MPDFNDALSNFRDKVSDVKKRVAERFELRRRKYLLKRRYRKNKDVALRKWDERYKAYLDYVLNEFLWITLANGLILNVPLNYFLGLPLTPYSVVVYGCLWYVLVVMTPSLRRDK